jgi:hypothetical protein
MADQKLSGVIGFYDDPESLLEGMKSVAGQNYQAYDAYTPFPVHGMDDVMGLKRSRLPFVTFVFGLTGVSLAFLIQYWTSAIDWAHIVGGRPFNSWPAFAPIMFELTVLLGGISTFVGMLALCRIPNVVRASFDPSITRDRFAIWIGKPDAGKEKGGFKTFQESEASQVLQQAGAKEVRTVYEEGWF